MRLHTASSSSMMMTAAVLVGPFSVTPVRSADAQGVHPSLLIGYGTGSWSGPYVQGSESAVNLAAALNWDVKPRLTLRAEGGLASRAAKMGRLGGSFDEKGTLSLTQGYAGALARVPLTSRDRGWHSYAEGGVLAYFGGNCDVDLTGGPGFFGGSTSACEDWVPNLSTAAPPISGVSSGLRPVLGLGATRRRIGATLRIEPMGTMAKTTTGDISSTAVTLNVEWTFGRRK